MKKLLIVLSIVALILAVGCTGGKEKPAATPAQTTVAPTTTPPPTTPAPTEMQVVLHGEGKCDMCHDAPTLVDVRAGKHKDAFEKFEGHQEFCKECHDVQSHCTQCHDLPSFYQ